ncbi:MAG: hypothetical protein ABR582_04835 [Gemmatimonadaceae bacterium]
MTKPKYVSETLVGGAAYQAAAARKNFFRILQDVSSGTLKGPVFIRHKGLTDDVAMVNARELEQSQKLLKALLKARKGAFKLNGSMKVDGDVEDVIAEGRAEDSAASARRLRRI